MPGGDHWQCETEADAGALADDLLRGVAVRAPDYWAVEYRGRCP